MQVEIGVASTKSFTQITVLTIALRLAKAKGCLFQFSYVFARLELIPRRVKKLWKLTIVQKKLRLLLKMRLIVCI
jgi:glucosamine 6-phosphate synthetase-like amidotransferase/phosphosugar isomerase protein